ncbi:MAG: ATP-binding cassette domain-containing protein, partial [Bullifex sp.]
MTALRADKLCFTYPYEDEPVIKDLSFSLSEGESLAVMGSNGSGKSTLLKLISGLLVPTSGRVITDGTVLSDRKSRKEAKRHVQSVFQTPYCQFVTSSPREEALLVASLFGRDESDICRVFGEYGITGFENREFSALSGGEKQKTALALAVLTGASVLVFDEALSSLDPRERVSFLDTILSLKKKDKTVVYITQEADEALLFDKLLILDDGAFSSPSELLYTGRYEFMPFELRLKKRMSEGKSVHIHYGERAVLECRNITAVKGSLSVLNDVSFSLHEGEVTGLTGDNGSGKTTLLDCISGFETGFSGKVTCRGNIGYAVQEAEKLFFCTSAEKELRYGNGKKDISDVLNLTGLDERLLDSSPFTLSGGEKRRLSIALFLMKDVKVLLLDEPSCALDQRGRDLLIRLIFSLKERGVSIVIADHNLELLSEVAESILRLEGGKCFHYGAASFFTKEVFDHYKIPLTEPMKRGY